jgi:hypothetical protein
MKSIFFLQQKSNTNFVAQQPQVFEDGIRKEKVTERNVKLQEKIMLWVRTLVTVDQKA